MEAALRSVLETSFGEYVDGLQQTNASFPLTLRDLKLKEKKVNDDLADSDVPFDLKDGRIGSVTISPGWMGNVEVVATNIVLSLSFNPMKVMKRMGAPQEPEQDQYEYYYEPVQPAAPPPPRFCHLHDSSEKREKTEPMERECKGCGVRLQTSYKEFTLCPVCSERHQACLICGCAAPAAGNYVPAKSINPQDRNQRGACCGAGGPPTSPSGRDFGKSPSHAQGGGCGGRGGAMDTLPPPPPQDWQNQRTDRGGRMNGSDIPPPPVPPQRGGYGNRDGGSFVPPPPQQGPGWQQGADSNAWGGPSDPVPSRGTNLGQARSWEAPPQQQPQQPAQQPQQQQQQWMQPQTQFPGGLPPPGPGPMPSYGGGACGGGDRPRRYGDNPRPQAQQGTGAGFDAFLGLFDFRQWGAAMGTNACNADVRVKNVNQAEAGELRPHPSYAY